MSPLRILRIIHSPLPRNCSQFLSKTEELSFFRNKYVALTVFTIQVNGWGTVNNPIVDGVKRKCMYVCMCRSVEKKEIQVRAADFNV